VLALGGAGNSVVLVRDLVRNGVTVRASGPKGCLALASRYCSEAFRVPEGEAVGDYWYRLLLSDDHRLDGSLIFALCDDSIDFICTNYAALKERYLVEGTDPELRLAMLDKKKTLEIAREAGVPTPNFWTINTIEDVDRIKDELTYPLMVKPIHSHLFSPIFGRKLFIIDEGFANVREKVALALEHGLEVMIVEMIPGPDSNLCSYYTYHDEEGRSLFEFTKRVIRRYPYNRGGAVYHETDWVPEAVEEGRKYFRSMPWRGMANIEFKLDLRDGKLKVIECNPRFTAAHVLVVASGAPIDTMIYCSVTGQPGPTFTTYKLDVRQWNPTRDILAFFEMRKKGLLTFPQWVKSILHRPTVLPVFDIRDPMPSLSFLLSLSTRIRKKFHRATERGTHVH